MSEGEGSSEGANCLVELLGFATIPQLMNTVKPMDEKDIQAAIAANFETQTEKETKAVKDFAEDRKEFQSPFHGDYNYALENDHNFRTIFSLSLMQTTVWVDNWFMDLFYYIVQKHPLLGYFAHEAHPLELADRSLIIVAGVCISLINQVTPPCADIASDECYELFIGNGMCEDGGDYTWLGTQANPKIFPCDFGTDASDCGNRSESMWRATVTAGHADGPGIWCFSTTELNFKNLIVAFGVIPLMMMIITKLILCECCITQQNNKKKIFWTDFGQNMGNSMVLVLCAMCGYFVHGDQINLFDFALMQAVIYGTIFCVNFVTFVLAYKLEKADIARHRGMENYIQAKMSLDGMFDDHDVGDK